MTDVEGGRAADSRGVGVPGKLNQTQDQYPEQVGQLLDSSAPEQEGQRVEVPDVKLVVQRTAEAHANEVRCEQNQNHLINSGFLSGGFPLAGILEEIEDAFSWPLPTTESEEQQGEQVGSQQD